MIVHMCSFRNALFFLFLSATVGPMQVFGNELSVEDSSGTVATENSLEDETEKNTPSSIDDEKPRKIKKVKDPLIVGLK